MATGWIGRVPFADGKRSEGLSVMGAALPALRALPGVEQVHFHPDANDPNTVWAYWRLTSRDHLFEVYESQAFKEMVQSSMALLADRPEDFFLDEEAGSP